MRPEKGSLRVQAWLYTAIDPMLDGCERDLARLARGDLTWRHVTGLAATMRPAAEHLRPAARVNLEDLLRFVPDLAKLLIAQDVTYHEALTAARAAHAAMVGDARFRAAVTAMTKASALRGRPGEDHVARAAERVVNGGAVSPEESAPLWRALVEELRAFAPVEELRQLGDGVKSLHDATATLVAGLREARERLCDEFDLPPAPVTMATL
jgi:hypothetical protein